MTTMILCRPGQTSESAVRQFASHSFVGRGQSAITVSSRPKLCTFFNDVLY